MLEAYFDFEESLVNYIDTMYYVKQLDTEVLELIKAEYGSVEAYAKECVCKSINQEGIYCLFEVLASCKRLEQLFLCQRFGLIDGRSKNIGEVASMFGITRERARQIERKCLRPRCRIQRRQRIIDNLQN